jgi:vitamin B12/bleomycin/antimicrobial peptide transport system ATP-binding/permease protein
MSAGTGKGKGKRHMAAALLATLLRSPARARLLALLLTVCLLIAGEVWISTLTLGYSGQLMDALTTRNAPGFYAALKNLVWAMLAGMAGGVLLGYLRGRLDMGARTALVHPWLRRWLGEKRLYRLEREHQLDNPDQRIAEDLRLFVEISLGLGLGLYSAVLGIGAFASMLWQQGGPLVFELGGRTWTIPGYLFWAALLFALVSTWLSRSIAKPLVGLTMRQQQVEADFRFGMIQVREHAEQVALYRGGEVEYERLTGRFEQIRQNWWRLIFYQVRWQAVMSGVTWAGSYAMYFLIGPRVLAGTLTMGAMTVLSGAFLQVSNQLNWFASRWLGIVQWIAVLERLKQMDQALDAPEQPGIEVRERDLKTVSVRGMALALPDGSALATVGDVQVKPGERWLLRGPSGVGKSTLLRAIAGMWPYGAGTVEKPAQGVMFLPQKSYLPWDTLKVALTYPRPADAYCDELCRRVLVDCRLPKLAELLHQHDRWNMRLSLGEQQRLAFARALLTKPDFLFLDESTSALDVDTERHLYQLLLDRLPRTALISVAHRPTLDVFHDHRLSIAGAEQTESGATSMPAPA